MSVIVYLVCGAATLLAARCITRFSRATAIVMLLLPLLFTGRALFTAGVFGPVDLAYTSEPLASIALRSGVGAVRDPSISDVYAQFMPWNDALRRSLARREWPLWNPYALSGTPLAGAAQSAPYHPITLAGLFVPLPQFFGFAAAMMMLSAVVSAFLLFREFTESEIAALFGAAAWMCSTHLIFFCGTALVFAAAVIPLVLLGARRIVFEPGLRSTAILAAALLLVVFAGHPRRPARLADAVADEHAVRDRTAGVHDPMVVENSRRVSDIRHRGKHPGASACVRPRPREGRRDAAGEPDSSPNDRGFRG